MELSGHYGYKRIIKFTMSSILMMIFTSIYSIVDGMFISNCVGSDAFAAINLIYPVIYILSGFGFMLGNGGCALVSKTLGEGDKDRANKYFSMVIRFEVIFGLILTILGIIFVKPISILLKAEGAVLDGCIVYGIGLLIPMVFFMLQTTFHSFLIAEGRPDLGLKISVLSGVLNIVGDFLFVYLLKWGLIGACIATGLGQVVGGILPLIYFMNKKKTKTIHLEKAKIELKPILSSSYNGISEMLNIMSSSIVMMLYNWQLMKLIGSDGVVAYGIVQYLQFVFAAIYIGYSMGIAPVVGYNYGAKDTKELKSVLRKSLTIIGLSAITMIILSESLSGVLSKIFVGYDLNLVELTKSAIKICGLAFGFCGFSIFGASFFTALNDGFTSGVIATLRCLVLQVICIVFIPMIFGLSGIWYAYVLAEFFALIVTTFLFIINKKRYQY